MSLATLTTTDAFFVAYQERAGIAMHLGAEVELDGPLARATLDAAVAQAVARWPALACTAVRTAGGLAWRPASSALVVETTDRGAREAWRNTSIDPFREPAFGVLWIRGADRHVLAFRAHHAVADGQLFLAIAAEIVIALAGTTARAPIVAAHPLEVRRLWREVGLVASVRHARALAREARVDRSARVALRAEIAGPVATCDRRIDAAVRHAIVERATAHDVRPPWLVAAAWIHALSAWNRRRGVTEPVLSLEVPVSMRRGPHALAGTGNHLTVLTLFGDARLPLATLARSLWDDHVAAIRRRDHLAIPLLGAPLRRLPWPVFRRVAVTTTSTGFATSHFTWVEHPDFRAALRERSGGALVVRDQRFYTPVCLRMGVALAVMAWPDELQLALTYRLTGLSAADADELADLLVATLRDPA